MKFFSVLISIIIFPAIYAIGQNTINRYEYWFDNNYAGKVLQTVTAQSQVQLLTAIDGNSLANGLHVFHVKFSKQSRLDPLSVQQRHVRTWKVKRSFSIVIFSKGREKYARLKWKEQWSSEFHFSLEPLLNP